MANYIGNQPSAGEFKHLDSITSQFNGSSVTFALKFNAVSQSVGDATQLIVSLNGVIQEPLTAYTLGTGGSTITFASAPQSGDTCFIVMLGGVGGTATPTDGSVTTAKIVDGAVTSSKISIDGDISFPDNDKAVFGDGSDLQIYHDGSNSYVRDNGTGTLTLQGTNQVKIQSPVTGENYAIFNDNGSVTLNYNNSLKFATNTNGISVAGEITVYNNNDTDLGHLLTTNNASDYSQHIFKDKQNSFNKFVIAYGNTHPTTPHDLYLKNNESTGNIGFVAGATEKMIIKSNGRVGIGNTDPNALLDVAGEGVFSGTLHNKSYADGDGIRVMGNESTIDIVGSDVGDHSSSVYIRNGTEGFAFINSPNDDAVHLRSFTSTADGFYAHAAGSNVSNLVNIATFERGGNVGIGTDNPSVKLHIQEGTGSLVEAFRISDSSYTNISMYSGGADGEIKIGAAGQLRGSYKAQYAGTGGSFNFNIGTNATNAITIDTSQNVEIATGDLTPGTATQDLGTSTDPWQNIYTQDMHLSNENREEGNSVDGTKGNWTIQEGEDDLYIINNKNGRKFRFALEEIV